MIPTLQKHKRNQHPTRLRKQTEALVSQLETYEEDEDLSMSTVPSIQLPSLNHDHAKSWLESVIGEDP